MVRSSRLAWFAVAAIALLLSGCCADPAGPPEETSAWSPFIPWSGTSTPTYGQFYAVSARHQGSVASSYLAGGEIFSSTRHGGEKGIDGGVMTASNVQIMGAADGSYETMEPPTFGAVTRWGLSGNAANGIPAFADSMVVPAEIAMASPVSALGMSKSEDMRVAWSVDPNNDSVVVGFEYMRGASGNDVINEPDTAIRWSEMTPDDGRFTISADKFADLPVGGMVRVVVSRGAGTVIGTASKKFHVYACSYADVALEILP